MEDHNYFMSAGFKNKYVNTRLVYIPITGWKTMTEAFTWTSTGCGKQAYYVKKKGRLPARFETVINQAGWRCSHYPEIIYKVVRIFH